jgi:hypothetical protein
LDYSHLLSQVEVKIKIEPPEYDENLGMSGWSNSDPHCTAANHEFFLQSILTVSQFLPQNYLGCKNCTKSPWFCRTAISRKNWRINNYILTTLLLGLSAERTIFPHWLSNTTHKAEFQKSSPHKGDMKQIPYWGSTNIKCHCKNFSHEATWHPGYEHPCLKTYVWEKRMELLVLCVSKALTKGMFLVEPSVHVSDSFSIPSLWPNNTSDGINRKTQGTLTGTSQSMHQANKFLLEPPSGKSVLLDMPLQQTNTLK